MMRRTSFCKDVTKWKSQVKFPNLEFPQAQWDECKAEAAKIDRAEKFATLCWLRACSTSCTT
jgi:hypothetical protein